MRAACHCARLQVHLSHLLWGRKKGWSDLQTGAVGHGPSWALPPPSDRRTDGRAAWCWRLPPGCRCALCTFPSRSAAAIWTPESSALCTRNSKTRQIRLHFRTTAVTDWSFTVEKNAAQSFTRFNLLQSVEQRLLPLLVEQLGQSNSTQTQEKEKTNQRLPP